MSGGEWTNEEWLAKVERLSRGDLAEVTAARFLIVLSAAAVGTEEPARIVAMAGGLMVPLEIAREAMEVLEREGFRNWEH